MHDHSIRRSRFGPAPQPLADRFWPKADKTGGCWLWTAARFSNGYGAFRVGDHQRKAHVVAWELAHGPVPDGQKVCHSCDVKHCVNPDHLFLADQKGNIADMWAKGRQRERRGTAMGKTVILSENDVREIRRLYSTGAHLQRDLAARFGVSQTAISHIVLRKKWSHVP